MSVFPPILERYFPDNNNITFVEPYAGGAGAALKLLRDRYVSHVIINDLDINIYSFWKSFFDHYHDFVQRVRNIPISLEEWKKQKLILDTKDASLFDRGFAVFYLNRTNHSGILAAAPIGGLKQDGKWKMDARFNRLKLIERLDYLYCFKRSISVENKDGIKVVKKHLGKRNTFLYIDPPYVAQGGSLYKTFHRKEKHKELARILTASSHYNWLLSYDDNSLIAQLYSTMVIEKKTLYHRLNRKKYDRECLIHNKSLVV